MTDRFAEGLLAVQDRERFFDLLLETQTGNGGPSDVSAVGRDVETRNTTNVAGCAGGVRRQLYIAGVGDRWVKHVRCSKGTHRRVLATDAKDGDALHFGCLVSGAFTLETSNTKPDQQEDTNSLSPTDI